MTQSIPAGFHTVTPSFIFKDTTRAIDFYKKAFNAELIDLFPKLNGTGVMHATMKIGNSLIMMGDEMDGNDNCSKSAESVGSSPISFFLYVAHVDEAFAQAVSAGGKVTMPVADMFWGDRVGQIKDPFGYSWMIATHTKDLTQEQIKKQAEEFFASMSKK
ncbi:VOC family protein [Legionella bononiensis]|uniref:VOC family protein n=1 Tax=Legionella bononiensis TaxID=2793102 RepID=A0ABS1WFG3_9GAMM|nr:VOC family protein [Legionella bononiensis]MBL7481532.1 VOC family protein [Legionella bononiensis]MBL7528079.1 VOC family protein [Legionella bononiensis]MBL7562555.1 VOC family protein [Legionella bononiensis]